MIVANSNLTAKIAKIDIKAGAWLRITDLTPFRREPYYKHHLEVETTKALLSAFTWRDTPQGHKYWYTIAKKLGEDV